MPKAIANIALLVREYDEAIAYFVNVLGFELREDTKLSDAKRWVVVAPPGREGGALLLAKAVGKEQTDAVGNQMGGRVGFFLHTDDFHGDYVRMKAWGVTFEEEPRHESYGTVVVFADLYGNRWDLLESKVATKPKA